jgi:GNAT superfamily N-acetyltransferase
MAGPPTLHSAVHKLDSSSGRATFDALAQLHIAEIHHGTLPLLGKRFLARLYQELTRAPQSGIWAAHDAGRMVGFVAGCADLAAAYRAALRRSAIPLALLGARGLVSLTALRKLPALLLYPLRARGARDSGGAPRAELLAIAVDPEMQGKGIGRDLVLALETAFREWRVDQYAVTTNRAETASNAFYVSLGFEPCGTMSHHELTLQRYRKPIERRGAA